MCPSRVPGAPTKMVGLHTMIISIVIATANREQAISECLASIAKLHIPIDTKIECVVVDNNSTDGTKEYLSSIPE